MARAPRPAGIDTDVLIVGAGPTGLTLARELHSLGVAAQIIDAAPDAVHESRALAIQARTLEVLARNRLADDLIAAGNPSGTLLLHESGSRGRTHAIPLFDSALGDTRFPFLLFLSQAGTERVFVDRLASAGVGVRRGLTLTGLVQDDSGVTATLESPGVPARVVRARYLVGCDGAHSATRRWPASASRGAPTRSGSSSPTSRSTAWNVTGCMSTLPRPVRCSSSRSPARPAGG
jgi:2-polyprenyl-6-methoxyphenol hydroxylase-like FAD-dependent oxidoreductase